MRSGSPVLGAGGSPSACSSEPPLRTHSVVDSAGVAIIQHGEIYAADLPVWRLSAEPSLRIGGDTELPDYQLYRVQHPTRLRDGSVAVVDYSRTRRLFDSSGAHQWTAGGQGDGPGELRFPSAVHVLTVIEGTRRFATYLISISST